MDVSKLVKRGFTYKFACTDSTDYECLIIFVATHEAFKYILGKSKIPLKRRTGYTIDIDIDNYVESFKCDPKFFNMIRMDAQLVHVARSIGKKGIALLSNHITDITYYRRKSDGDWDVVVTIKGQYSKNSNIKPGLNI